MKRSMGWLVSSVAVLGLTGNALAADPPDVLRGSQVFAPGPALYSNWSGFYFGAQGGWGRAHAEFGARADSVLAALLATTPLPGGAGFASVPGVLLPDNINFGSFGAFFGYNAQWEDAVLGIDVNYHYVGSDASASVTAPFTIGLTGAPPTAYNVDVTKTSVISLTDYATVRGRAGWAFGWFMPYATGGLAFGRADITNSARVHYVAINALGVPVADVTQVSTLVQNDQFSWGYTLGLGFDMQLMSGLFLRAEYEYVDFWKFSDRKLTLNNLRAGLGYKF